MSAIGHGEMAARLALAAVYGSAVGLERERLLWAAGLRTHMLVCVGACLAMLVSIHGFADVAGAPGIAFDPSRVAAQVVSGIGFLGAGTILLRGEVVKGLTTAASLWAVAAVGLAVGGGLYAAATVTVVLVVGILAGVKPLEERWHERARAAGLRLVVRRGSLTPDRFHELSRARASSLRQFVVTPGDDPDLDEVAVRFARVSRKHLAEIAARLRAADGVVSVEEVA